MYKRPAVSIQTYAPQKQIKESVLEAKDVSVAAGNRTLVSLIKHCNDAQTAIHPLHADLCTSCKKGRQERLQGTTPQPCL